MRSCPLRSFDQDSFAKTNLKDICDPNGGPGSHLFGSLRDQDPVFIATLLPGRITQTGRADPHQYDR